MRVKIVALTGALSFAVGCSIKTNSPNNEVKVGDKPLCSQDYLKSIESIETSARAKDYLTAANQCATHTAKYGTLSCKIPGTSRKEGSIEYFNAYSGEKIKYQCDLMTKYAKSQNENNDNGPIVDNPNNDVTNFKVTTENYKNLPASQIAKQVLFLNVSTDVYSHFSQTQEPIVFSMGQAFTVNKTSGTYTKLGTTETLSPPNHNPIYDLVCQIGVSKISGPISISSVPLTSEFQSIGNANVDSSSAANSTGTSSAGANSNDSSLSNEDILTKISTLHYVLACTRQSNIEPTIADIKNAVGQFITFTFVNDPTLKY